MTKKRPCTKCLPTPSRSFRPLLVRCSLEKLNAERADYLEYTGLANGVESLARFCQAYDYYNAFQAKLQSEALQAEGTARKEELVELVKARSPESVLRSESSSSDSFAFNPAPCTERCTGLRRVSRRSRNGSRRRLSRSRAGRPRRARRSSASSRPANRSWASNW